MVTRDSDESASPAGQAAEPQKVSSNAVSREEAAHAEFYRDDGSFLLYDDSPDGKAAVLVTTIDGSPPRRWYNVRGHTYGKSNAQPKPIDLPGFTDSSTVKYRVCVGEYKAPLPDDTCGTWTTDNG